MRLARVPASGSETAVAPLMALAQGIGLGVAVVPFLLGHTPLSKE